MIDGDKLLRGLMSGGLGKSTGGLAKGGGLMMLGGLAFAAFEHFANQGKGQGQQQPPRGPQGSPFGAATRPPSVGHAPPPPPPAAVPPTMPASPPPVAPPPSAAMSAPPPVPPSSAPPTMAPAAAPTAPPNVPPPAVDNDKALLLVKAMIAAAKADGEIDAQERATILGALDEQGQGVEAHEFVETEMAKPLNLFEITSGVTDEETARQVYIASCMAIDIDTEAERSYLDRLAARIGLEPDDAREIEKTLANPPSDLA